MKMSDLLSDNTRIRIKVLYGRLSRSIQQFLYYL